MVKDGRPYSNENGSVDDALVTDLSQEEQGQVLAWIREKILPRKATNTCHSSYGIKHILQHDTGIYVTNNQFKDAMMVCGYMPSNPCDLNWHYHISEKSPAFQWKQR